MTAGMAGRYASALFALAPSVPVAVVANAGRISANGGTVVLSARSGGDLASLVVNNTGIIQANSLAAGATIHPGQQLVNHRLLSHPQCRQSHCRLNYGDSNRCRRWYCPVFYYRQTSRLIFY